MNFKRKLSQIQEWAFKTVAVRKLFNQSSFLQLKGKNQLETKTLFNVCFIKVFYKTATCLW